jgi:peptide deformylase
MSNDQILINAKIDESNVMDAQCYEGCLMW